MNDKNSQALPPIADKDGRKQERFTKQNWVTFKKNDHQLKKMAPQLRSRYNAYEEPPKAVAEQQAQAKGRLKDWKKIEHRQNQPPSLEDVIEKDKHEKLIGQLKAAEARNRIRIMRLRYESHRKQEIRELIMCQPTARKAVRLQALLPVKQEETAQRDSLSKLSRNRVEALLEDTQGLLTSRT